MLFLIAAANSHYWFRQDPNASAIYEHLVSGLLYLLVEGRTYPLFALLLGFGLATISRKSFQESLATGLDRKQAKQRATALLRRRGVWMLAFGAMHALLFAQDILGAYGLITMMVASIVVSHRWRSALILTAFICTLSTSFLAAAGPEVALARSHGSAAQALFDEHLSGVAANLVTWVVATPMTILSSMVLPSALLGAWLAGQGLIEQPYRYRRELVGVVLVGLAMPSMTFPMLWVHAPSSGIWARVLVAWHQGLAGLLTGVAFLALVALVVSYRATVMGTFNRALTATGKHSLSAYLSQTVLFALSAGALRLCSVEALALAWQVLAAAIIWLVSMLLCSLMERCGVQGLAEQALRRLVATDSR